MVRNIRRRQHTCIKLWGVVRMGNGTGRFAAPIILVTTPHVHTAYPGTSAFAATAASTSASATPATTASVPATSVPAAAPSVIHTNLVEMVIRSLLECMCCCPIVFVGAI